MGGATAARETGFLACSLAVRVLAGEARLCAGDIKNTHCFGKSLQRDGLRRPQPADLSDPTRQVFGI